MLKTKPLRYLPCLLLPLFLTGCPIPGAPLVGLPSEDKVTRETVLYDSMASADEEPRLRIVEQQIDHNYDLYFSPDGNRPDQTVRTSVRHLIRYADGSSKSLPFLRSSYLNLGRAHAAPLYKVQGTANWLGYARFSGSGASASLHFYIVTVFSEHGIVSRNEILSTTSPAYAADLKAVRYTAPDGPRMFLATENRIVADAAR
jgi:hypothetical protein